MLASLIGCDRDYEPIIADMPISRNIDDLKITISDNIPAHVTVEFLAFLDGCEFHHNTDHYWSDGNTIRIEVKMRVSTGPGYCPTSLDEHRESVYIGKLYPGTYVVYVNGRSKTFHVSGDSKGIAAGSVQ